MPKLAQKELEKFIIRRLLNDRYVGAHQTLEENIVKYVPKDSRGEAKKALEKVKRRGWLLLKHKHYGIHVSIDPNKLAEIRAFLL